MKNKLFWGLLLGAAAAGGCKSAGSTAENTMPKMISENGVISPYRVGQFEVYMLVEAEREGNAGILINAGEAIEQYIPEGGFKHSTNAFLIKAPGRNILVDTAFGGAVFESMKKLGVEPDQVDAVLITHLHGDHTGGLQKDGNAVFPKATIYLSANEHKYFTQTNVNEGAVAALAPYGSRVKTFEPGDLDGALTELLPGITPIANYGHTPGHTLYLVENSGAKFLIIGDMLHIALVQFPVPEISATYDTDSAAAAAVRRQVLDYAAKNNMPLGGMHMVYPGMGAVEASGAGFKFTPVE
ncbi:MAG: MBL fold metallo-hydrolase [Treponema sp.]|jgi:glyoxylase-like metal-dependent hydrolase (beta-lactamase superfamily II)|nr:MBL fold metallo-hydrolase [Treponema sp.]